jgi:Zn2+/Cd2+-exporting ATPase
MRVAKAIGWADIADALREHLQVCCISLGLLLVAAVCPHVALLNSVSRLQDALISVAFPLVGVKHTNSSPLTFAPSSNVRI